MSSIDNQHTNQAAKLSDSVLSELQLRHQPFTSEPDSGNSFVDEITEAQLEDIKQALISGDDLLLILGPKGSGKSTLLNQLGAKSGQRIQCFSVRGSDRFSTANLFAGMIEAFKKQPPDDLKLMLDELIPCLQGMADHNTLGTVVLDDADLVPESELTKLLSGMLYLNSRDETLLRVTLAAPTEFEERIPELLPEGADLPYSSLAIDALDKTRSAAYLDYRLQQAGLTGDFPFSDDEIATINEEAGGRPGLLHAVAARHLNAADENFVGGLPPELEERKKKAARGGWLEKIGGVKLLAGALALAMILAGLFWLKPNSNSVPDDRYKVVENKKLETDKQTTSEESATEIAANANATDNSATTTETVDNTASIAAEAEAAKAEAQHQAKIEQDAAEKEAAEKAAAEKLALEKAAAQKAAAEKLANEKLAAEQAAAAELAEETAAKEKAAAAEAAKLAEATVAETSVSAGQPAAAVAEPGVTTQSALNNLESPNWILVQNPALFTVQMSASKDRASVENFLARTGLEPPNSIFSFERNGNTWYALVHGLYDNIEEARQDIEKMPENTRSNQPWIRAVGRIQKAMKEQQ